jgi:DNA polymerase III delta subunit
MLCIYFGANRELSKKQSETFVSVRKKDGFSVLYFDDSNFVEDDFINPSEGEDLFGGKKVVVGKNLFSRKEIKEFILKVAKRVSESKVDYCLLEDEISKADIEVLDKVGVVLNESKATPKKNEDFNTFALADFMMKRDKKNLWVMYRKAIDYGKTPEEIAGVLFWQLKVALLVRRGEEKGISPFAVSKARGLLKNFKDGEIESALRDLVDAYHLSRGGIGDMELSLERFVLSI